ncbi:hypothetical protein HY495_03905 [Candidatus Woesearchaeota archaeon]|nr:hypothetical protein [Candidatus Woesearchaeota archaeon]
MSIVDLLQTALIGERERRLPPLSDSEQKRRIEQNLRKISDGKLVYSGDPNAFGLFENFGNWASFAESINNPDTIRAAIYAAFQPLYDHLIDDRRIGVEPRKKAVVLLNGLITLGVDFLTSYYSGEPDKKRFKEGVALLKQGFDEISFANYRQKDRNIGQNAIFPNDIVLFLQEYLQHSLDGNKPHTDYVVGAACGSSEVAMPLAGLLGVDVGFIRNSKRRGDSHALVIPEQEPVIKEAARNKRVICIEDYVCTGKSLRDVMKKVEGYGVASVQGASVRNSHDWGFCLKETTGKSGFHVYSFK